MADADAGIVFRSIAALGRDYRRGALSPTAVVEACLQRIDRDDGQLNAIVSTLAESARTDAARAEEELAAGRDRGPLHGIPVGIKDLVNIAGTVTGFGSDPVFAAPATRDAAMVAHLREAGAVLIAKTNLLEFAYGAVNPRVGQTNNPWDTGRTAGGSSGGSAASVAAGLCYAAVGTDTGGSIRIPAAYCGAVGLKPTYGLVPLAGVSMLSWSLDHAGPIARSCADAAALLGRAHGNVRRCVAGQPPRPPFRAHRSAQGLRRDHARRSRRHGLRLRRSARCGRCDRGGRDRGAFGVGRGPASRPAAGGECDSGSAPR